MRSLSLFAIVALLAGCLVSLDESLWKQATADTGPATETNDALTDEQQTDTKKPEDSLAPEVGSDAVPLDATPDLPLDVAPDVTSPDVAPDVTPPDVTPDVTPPDQCADTCTAGATRCHTSAAMQSCQQAPSGCLDWGLPVSCPANQACADDKCALTCTDQCNAGERRCTDLTAEQACEMTSTGCRDWATPDSCDWNERCFAGLCLLICSANGIPMPCDPSSSQSSGCFEGDCYLTSNGPACICPAGVVPNGGACDFGIDCEPAHVCVGPANPTGTCRPMCDPDQPACAVGSCITISTFPDYGYCQP